MSRTTTTSTTPGDTPRFETPSRTRLRMGIVTTFLGLFVFIVGAKPNWLGLDRSPVVGFVQITVFLIGLGMIGLGGYVALVALWRGRQRTIAADFGSRLVSTGYVVATFAGMADVFGMGSQPLPDIPYFGPWQASGVLVGQATIALGFLLLVPYRSPATD
jgi:hypothetical protein